MKNQCLDIKKQKSLYHELSKYYKVNATRLLTGTNHGISTINHIGEKHNFKGKAKKLPLNK